MKSLKTLGICGLFSMALIVGGNTLAQAGGGGSELGYVDDNDLASRPGSWGHVDEMAEELQGLSEEFHDVIHLHLEGHEYFHHIDEHVKEIESLAQHVHEIAHNGGNITHLRADILELAGQVAHADEVVTQIARRGVIREHYDGGVRQTRRLMNSMMGIMQHLETDLAILDGSYRPHRVHRPVYVRPSQQYHDRYPNRGYHQHDLYYRGHDLHHHHD